MPKKIEVDAKELEKVSGGYVRYKPIKYPPCFQKGAYTGDVESTAVTNTSPNTADNK